MNIPLFKYGLFEIGLSFVLAILLGAGFGFFLERGGFGNAKKLSGQFYLKDFTVFKGMFTAVIVAILGVFWLTQFGVLNLEKIYMNPTYVVPQIIAGLIFGLGFVLSGLCPGTALVSFASGKLDGLITVLGVIFGIFVFGEAYDLIKPAINKTYLGPISLPQVFGMPKGIFILIVIIIATAAFIFINSFERKRGLNQFAITRVQKSLIGLLIVIGLIGGFTKNTHSIVKEYQDKIVIKNIDGHRYKSIGVHKLAEWIIQKTPDLMVIDLRTKIEFDKYHIPSIHSVHLSSLNDTDLSEYKVVLYFDADLEGSALDEVIDLKPMELYVLDGGMEKWQRGVLHPDLTLLKENVTKVKRISSYFGGDPFEFEQSKSSSANKFSREGC